MGCERSAGSVDYSQFNLEWDHFRSQKGPRAWKGASTKIFLRKAKRRSGAGDDDLDNTEQARRRGMKE
jgi:hypothetical protein